jgi:hypothetical protein
MAHLAMLIEYCHFIAPASGSSDILSSQWLKHAAPPARHLLPLCHCTAASRRKPSHRCTRCASRPIIALTWAQSVHCIRPLLDPRQQCATAAVRRAKPLTAEASAAWTSTGLEGGVGLVLVSLHLTAASHRVLSLSSSLSTPLLQWTWTRSLLLLLIANTSLCISSPLLYGGVLVPGKEDAWQTWTITSLKRMFPAANMSPS